MCQTAEKNESDVQASAALVPRTLFFSFTGATDAFARGEIADFEGGLFYFGCTRDFFLDCEKEGVMRDWTHIIPQFNDDSQRAMAAYRMLREAILQAEKEGRVRWRRNGEDFQKIRALNRLFAANGLPQIPGDPNLDVIRKDLVGWLGEKHPGRIVVI